MRGKGLLGAVFAATALAIPVAGADPEPAPAPPPTPNVNAFALANTPDFVVNSGVYAFSAPGGLTCVLTRASSSYGCNGPMPGAPGGANLVTGGAAGEPGFSVADRPIYQFDTPVRELAAGSRLSMGTVSCGVDGGGSVICVNSYDQTGFVVGPGGSSTFGAVNPLLDRPEGTNPFIN